MIIDDCGNDCHETDCPDRVSCEHCSATPHRLDAVSYESGRLSWYLCAECEEQEKLTVQIRLEKRLAKDKYLREGH